MPTSEPPQEPPSSARQAPSGKRPDEEASGDGRRGALGAAFFAVAAIGLGVWVWRAPTDGRTNGTPADAPEEGLTAAASAPSAAAPPPAPRCTRIGTNAFRIGKNSAPSEPSEPGGELEGDELPAAFGAEVSRAIPLGADFAVGLRHDLGDGAHAAVAVVSGDASQGTTIDLGRSRGDFDAPIVAPLGEGWLAGLLEPHASGATLKVGVGSGRREPRFGVELEQGRDESLAFDVASGAAAVLVAWDDVTKDGKLGRVLWATLDLGGKRVERRAAVASGKAVDAETPRVVGTPRGFWLAYIARKALDLPKDPDDAALDRNPKGDRYAAEKIDPSWLELMPLDEHGVANGPPRAVTAKEGHVLSYDLATTPEGSAVIVWRDDDTPSGSHGGRVSLMTVTASGGSQAQVLAEEDVGSGVPSLLPGWVAVADAAGRARLAPLAADGTVTTDLRLEPAVGSGEPLALAGGRMLVATSAGTAIDLTIVECKP